MSDQAAKTQIVDKLKDVDNVLITVSSSPSVDELSAALGFTLLVNKLNKHATAVFSGDIPPAITFLDPEKTFENTVDSLRDFIIALDKEKADHLRYKVEGDMVKIFITPYRTVIDEKDLDFSQGDYNVEMVVAIGVKNDDDLDRALADHGRIMHDAVVASLSIRDTESDLGTINWHENDASSYSEMLVSISESLRNDKNLIDEQIATAFLTGIVAATDRFSNDVTNSKVMTMAAQLMAAGANQQLIATKLEEAKEIATKEDESDQLNKDGTTDLSDNVGARLDKTSEPDKKSASSKNSKSSKKAEKTTEPEEPVEDRPAADGSMKISHEKTGTIDEVAKATVVENQAAAAKKAEEALEKATQAQTAPEVAGDKEQQLANDLAGQGSSSANNPGNMPSVADLQKDLKAAAEEVERDAETPLSGSAELSLPEPSFIETPHPSEQQPSIGGTLNATTEQAAEDKRREFEQDRNKTILSHGSQYVDSAPSSFPAVNSFNQAPSDEAGPSDTPLIDSATTAKAPTIQPPGQPTSPTLEEIDRENRGSVDSLASAQTAMEQALSSAPSLNDQQQTIPSLPPLESVTPSLPNIQDNASLPPLPPMPDFSTLPPLPGASPAGSPSSELDQLLQTPNVNATPPPPAPVSNDPSQFKIPGQ